MGGSRSRRWSTGVVPARDGGAGPGGGGSGLGSGGGAGGTSGGDHGRAGDGRVVAFQSYDSDLVPGDTGGRDLFVHDLTTGRTERVSVPVEGGALRDPRSFGFLTTPVSADGRTVVFDSFADNLVEGDTNEARDLFVGPAADIARPPPGTVGALPGWGTLEQGAGDGGTPDREGAACQRGFLPGPWPSPS